MPREHIRHLADVSGRAMDEVGAMEISVTFHEHRPPAGRLRVVDHAPEADGSDAGSCVAFAGWMELLRALDSLLAPSPSEGPQS